MRREALVTAFAALAACAGIALADGNVPKIDESAPRLLRAGPLVGYDADGIAVWAEPVTRSSRLDVEFSLDPSAPKPADGIVTLKTNFPPVAAAECSSSLRQAGFARGARYLYRVLVDGRSDETTSGSFRAPPKTGDHVKATFAVVSCMNVKRHPRQVAWKRLMEEHPDLLIQLGDNVYSDSTDPEVLYAWHTAQRRVPEYAEVIRNVPTIAIWDDHDFATNDSDGTAPGKDHSLDVFYELWPNPNWQSRYSHGRGIYFKTSYGDVDIFMTDGRYERSPDLDPDDEKKRMFGEAQWRWLEREVAASRAKFKLVASGSSLSAIKDSWRLYSRDRERLFSLTSRIPGIVFVTGDIHTAVIGRAEPSGGAGYPIYELISSGVAVNPDRHYFMTLSVDTTLPDASLTARTFQVDAEGKVVQRTERTILASELVPAL